MIDSGTEQVKLLFFVTLYLLFEYYITKDEIGGRKMYQQSYEDYMRSVLGYSMDSPNYMSDTYEGYPYANTEIRSNNPSCNCNLDDTYPEIYRIVNPMVCKVCQENTRTITKEVIDEMTEIVYRTVEPSLEENRSSEVKESELKNGDVRNPNVKKAETKVENRGGGRPNNYLLRDLIKILIINQLIGGGRPPFPGPGPVPPRPPFPGRPPRPPFPGGPGPIMPPRPRDYNDMVMF